MEAKIIRVQGKVQGVFFRNSTKEMADSLGVKGWVKNEKDGSVLIQAEADAVSIKKFIEWCSSGPKLARVDKVDVEDTIGSSFSSFEVLR